MRSLQGNCPQAFLDFSQTLEVVHIEQIQDFVEIQLMKSRPDVAKLYILYREERARLREQGWSMTDLQRIFMRKIPF